MSKYDSLLPSDIMSVFFDEYNHNEGTQKESEIVKEALDMKKGFMLMLDSERTRGDHLEALLKLSKAEKAIMEIDRRALEHELERKVETKEQGTQTRDESLAENPQHQKVLHEVEFVNLTYNVLANQVRKIDSGLVLENETFEEMKELFLEYKNKVEELEKKVKESKLKLLEANDVIEQMKIAKEQENIAKIKLEVENIGLKHLVLKLENETGEAYGKLTTMVENEQEHNMIEMDLLKKNKNLATDLRNEQDTISHLTRRMKSLEDIIWLRNNLICSLYEQFGEVKLEKRLLKLEMEHFREKLEEKKKKLEREYGNKERSFTGNFTTAEAKKAVELGYTITNVFHAIEYKTWTSELFTSYVNKMMTEKVYSSGWPEDVKTDDDKDRYIEEYKNQGIIVSDKGRFISSPGARLASKLLLNSLWGKFAQRVDHGNTVFLNDPAKFWKLFHDTSVVMEDVHVLNEVVILRYTNRAETIKSLSTGAMHIAAHVPSYGRLHLYDLMTKAGADNILYTDTDSVIYTVPHGSEDPLKEEMGPYLGQVTDELQGRVTKFVATAGKSYGYIQLLPNGEEKTKIKSKGITLNSEAAKLVTFDKMKELVDEVITETPQNSSIQVPQQIVKRDKNLNVFFKATSKKFRYTFDKRRVLPDGSTLPFGYVDN